MEELTQIVRLIIQESLEECKVTGTMKGRAKVNLAVVGSVEAKMECSFEGISKVKEINLPQPCYQKPEIS